LCRERASRLLIRETQPLLEVPHSFVGAESGACKRLAAGRSDDPVIADFDFPVRDSIASGSRAGRRHTVCGKKGLPGRLGTEEILEHTRRQVNPVGNEKRRQVIAGQQPLSNVVVPVHFQGHSVSKMCAELSPGGNRPINIFGRGIRMAERYMNSAPDHMGNEFLATRKFWSQRDEFDVAPGCVLQSLKIGDLRRPHKLRIMGSPIACQSREPWALEVISANRVGNGRVAFPYLFGVPKLPSERIDAVRNECEKKPIGLMRGESIYREPEIGGSQIGLLEVHARKPVDLNIEEAGFQWIKRC